MVTVGIVGASGYGGGELLRLLSRHPDTKITYIASDSNAGEPIRRSFPGLSGTYTGDILCEKFDALTAAMAADVVFLAQENGAAMRSAPAILEMGKRVIDLSADFRLRDADTYERWYKIPHTAVSHLREWAVYGLPEWNRDALKSARLVAGPGCHPTAANLALIPLLQVGIVSSKNIIIDAKCGVSGAGRSKSDTLYRYGEANESVKPYNIGGAHRHTPEIEQELARFAAEPPIITFTPHLMPMTRGLMTTCYARVTDPTTATEDILAALRAAYIDAPFVVVRDATDYPATKDVAGSNFCHIGARLDARTGLVTVVSVIDNLVKGTAGQAIQCMNLCCDLPETTGLEGAGIWP